MNTFFFLGLARTDLGKSVAIEFIGPIAVAAAMTRTARNGAAPWRSPPRGRRARRAGGRRQHGGPVVDPRRLGDVGVVHRRRLARRPDRPGRRRARHRPGDRGGRHHADRRPGQRRRVHDAATARRLRARRRVLQRHRLRHRPARAAAHPGAPLLRAPRPLAGDGGGFGWIGLDQVPSGVEFAGIALVLAGVILQERDELPTPAEADAP